MLDFRKELIQEAKATAAADGGGTSAAFVGIFANYLVNAEVLPDFQPAFYSGEGKYKRRLRVDGYVFDEFDGTMNLVVASFVGDEEAHRLIRSEAEPVFEWPLRFVEEVLSTDLYKRIEMSTPASDLVDLLRQSKETIRRYKVLLFSDGVISGRIEALPIKEIGGVPAECQIWDISRLYKVCLADMGQESIEIDFTQFSPHGLPCVEARSGAGNPYTSFLSVIPGTVLANVYDRYGAQLLEGNVRSFLSTKVAVNKRIRETILNAPSMFFAFNNGISVTATDVRIDSRPEGTFITYARDFQIINGGQTTASLSNARHRDKADLSSITVQMKLTKINAAPEETLEVVQKIARSSNSQNKVSDADFFSTHPFHIRMEQISRRLFAPAAGGAQYETRWFYERARGQYLQEQMRMTEAQRKKFAMQNPKAQLVNKTDLAKVRNSWRGLPHIVSKGAQANFMEFAEWVDTEWASSSDVFNEKFYQDTIALFILFKHVEWLVTRQPWYQQGYRANIVTYSIALLKHLIGKQYPKHTLDLRNIWNRQAIPDPITKELLVITEEVMRAITDPNRPVVNVTQWCKREACWTRVKALPIQMGAIGNLLVSDEVARAEGRMAKQDQQVVSGIEAQTEVVNRTGNFWRDVQRFLTEKRHRMSPDERIALQIACQLPAKIPTPAQSHRLLVLAERATAEGFKAG